MQILTDSGPALTSVSVVPGIIMLPSVWYAGRFYQKLMYAEGLFSSCNFSNDMLLKEIAHLRKKYCH